VEGAEVLFEQRGAAGVITLNRAVPGIQTS
jgi:hypothetical protein